MNAKSGPSAMSVLRRITNRPPPDPDVEKCDMCAEPIPAEHGHVVDISSRQLMCTCRGCRLLFASDAASLRYRAVPDRYLSFVDFTLPAGGWDALDIPVGLAFFFSSSVSGEVTAFYPGPAGVAESELALDAWSDVLRINPELAILVDDVEALLVRADDGDAECFLVPIDVCYELSGRLRTVWRGFDGGQDARAVITKFFDRIRKRSKLVPRPPSDEVRPSNRPDEGGLGSPEPTDRERLRSPSSSSRSD